MDCSPPGPSVHGIFHARVLEWVAIAFSSRICCSLQLQDHGGLTFTTRNFSLVGLILSLDSSFRAMKRKWVAIYTDSKYAILVLHVQVSIWKERGQLTTWGSSIKYDDQILWFLEAVHLPAELSVSHCRGQQKASTEVSQENQAADQTAQRAALQSCGLIEVASLVPQAALPEAPLYTKTVLLKQRVRAFNKIV